MADHRYVRCLRAAPILGVGLQALVTVSASAQIVTDGSLGAGGAIAGPNYTIDSGLGTTRGANLFHSFDRFSIRHGETATFTGPGSIRNIVSRVTGGEVSKIHGTLRSGIAGANVFLINPAGVVFGAGAQVDVSGAFVVSTADELRLADGGKLGVTAPADTVLTTAAPAAFGFLGSNSGVIAVNGTIAGADDRAVTLVADDIQLRGGKVASRGGSIDLVALGGAGTVQLTPAAAVSPHSTVAAGDISLRPGSEVRAQDAGSRIAIRGGRITLNNARVVSSDSAGGGVAVNATDRLFLRNGAAVESEAVNGVGGHIRVAAGELLVNGATSFFPTGLISRVYGSGDGGNIQVAARSIRLVDGGQVISSTGGDGHGGNISLVADEFVASGRSLAGASGGVLSSTAGFGTWGDGGAIRIAADHGYLRNNSIIASASLSNGLGGHIRIEGASFDIRSGGLVQATTQGSGPGGAVRFDLLGQLSIVGNGGPDAPNQVLTGIRTDSGQFTPTLALITDTGAVDLNVGSLYIANGGNVSLSTIGRNGLGNLRVRGQTVVLAGRGSGLFVNSQGAYIITGDPDHAYSGDAGNIRVIAKRVEVRDGATITASTIGTGHGGSIAIAANDLLIDGVQGEADFPTGITASTLLPVIPDRPDIVGGDAGSVLLDITGTVAIRNGGTLSVFTQGGGDGGDAVVRAQRFEMFSSDDYLAAPAGSLPTVLSATTQSLEPGAGRAGAIAVRAGDLFIGPGSQLSAGTLGPGLGGVVHLASTGDLVIDGKGHDTNFRPTIDVSYGSVSGQGESGNLILWAGNDLIIRHASVSATAVSGDGGYVAVGTTRPDAPFRVKRQAMLPRRLMIEDSTLEAESEQGNGGWVLLHADELVSVRRGRLAASAKGRGGRIDIDPDVVVIDDVEVFARAELLEGGDIRVRGGTYLRSPDAVFDVTSQSGLDGSISEAAQLDLSGTLLPLVANLDDDMAQLFEQCAVKLGQGLSSFIVVGRGGLLPLEPGMWLPAYALPPEDAGTLGATE